MSEPVLFAEKGELGLITLNRPSALNALTLPMIMSIQKQLDLWKKESSIHAVVIKANPGKAFCAGGDVRTLYNAGKAHDPNIVQFFWHEYRLNYSIHHFGKPFISLIDGIVMGGGVGVSLHGSHPIASERFAFAMPEANIGFFPDIGASHLLNLCPGNAGTYLALTGKRIGAEDAKKLGLIRQIVASNQFSELLEALIDEDLSKNAFVRVDACVQHFAKNLESDKNSTLKSFIEPCFAHDSIGAILKALDSSGDKDALELSKDLARKSPLSLKVIMQQMHKTRGLSLADCLKIDYDLVQHFIKGSDFYEGVRARLIDKDDNPQWHPKSLDLVSESMVISYFERMGPGLELS